MSDAWNEYYTDEEIKQIQKIEIRSLDILDDVCKKLNIRFFMYGGSLLGAVKYQGFVPWDDDLDIAMLRPDYERFIKEAPELLAENYEIQHPSINSRTPYHYVKFRRTDTALVEYWNHKIKINHGVYFDIYPIDNLPDDYADYLKQKLKYDKWVSIFQARQNFRLGQKVCSWKMALLTSWRFCRSMVLRLIPLRCVMKKIDKISTQYNLQTTRNQGNLTYPKPVNFFDGFEAQEAVFEERIVYIPSGYRVNLRNRYGDINRLPPEAQRVGHKPYILDLGGEKQDAH